jgi:hypothetical protein
VTIAGTVVKVSAGNKFTVSLLSAAGTAAATSAVATGYCISGINDKGSTTTGYSYNSLDGGLKTVTGTTNACVANVATT